MLLIRILNIILLLLLAFDGSIVQYRIISLSSEYIIIGSEKKAKGELFKSDDVIHWENDAQVMRVMDVETEEIFVLSKKIANVASRHTKADYRGLVSSLSTDLQEIKTSNDNGGYYYIKYSNNSETGEVRLTSGMFLDEFPQKLHLFYHNPTSSKEEFRTDDFRGFVDDLVITDFMVKRHMAGVDYFIGEEEVMKRDYMMMMRTYVDEKYRDIIYTYEDLKMFITLKY